MKTTKYEIELPTPPEGMEIVGYGESQRGDFAFMPTMDGFRWKEVGEKGDWTILARRKRTLADWANEQPLFKALADMRHNAANNVAVSGGTSGPWWTVAVCFGGSSIVLKLGVPPCDGKLTLKDGKWDHLP